MEKNDQKQPSTETTPAIVDAISSKPTAGNLRSQPHSTQPAQMAAAPAPTAASRRATPKRPARAAGSAPRRKRTKLPDIPPPDHRALLMPESALFTQLAEFEAQVDEALERKRIDIQETLKATPLMQKTLRVYIFNTFFEARGAEPPSWSLKIIGRLVEDSVDGEPVGGVSNSTPPFPKFSYFVKRVTIMLDQSLYPDNSTVVWEHSRSTVQHEGFEVRRIGDKEFTAKISLEMNCRPEKFKLSPALMELLGIEVDTRPRVLAGIWSYVRGRKLQNPVDTSYFVCDLPLQNVFGEEMVKFSTLPKRITPHLTPMQAIRLEHKIVFSGNGNTSCYDVLVDVPLQLPKDMAGLFCNPQKLKEIQACDEVIAAYMKKIHVHKMRRAFYLRFSQDPAKFINDLIASQERDLKLVAGEGSQNVAREAQSDFFNQPWVEDAIVRYMSQKSTGDNNTASSN